MFLFKSLVTRQQGTTLLLRSFSAKPRKFPTGTTLKSDPTKFTTFHLSLKDDKKSSHHDEKLEDDELEEGEEEEVEDKKKTNSPPPPPTGRKRLTVAEMRAVSHPPPVLLRLNDNITGVDEARLIHEDGTTISTCMSFEDCLREAQNANLDLVEVCRSPPVLKLQDFNKVVEAKREQRKISESRMGFKPADPTMDLENVKEVQISPSIDTHDFNMKRELIKKFLKKKHPVKLVFKSKRGSAVKSEDRPQRTNQLLERMTGELNGYIEKDTKQKPKTVQGSLVLMFFPRKDEQWPDDGE